METKKIPKYRVIMKKLDKSEPTQTRTLYDDKKTSYQALVKAIAKTIDAL